MPARPAADGAGNGRNPGACHLGEVDPGTVVAAIKAAYDAYKTFAGGGSSAVATAQIIAAIKSAETAIIGHIDAIATADARACAQSAVLDFPDFDNLTPDNRQNFALKATSCVTEIDSLLARGKAGLHNDTLVPVLREANQKIRTPLVPRCVTLFDPDSHTKRWFCTAFNGHRADDVTQPDAQDAALAGTSWEIAAGTLTQLAGL